MVLFIRGKNMCVETDCPQQRSRTSKNKAEIGDRFAHLVFILLQEEKGGV